MNEYEYKGNKYTLKDNTLELYREGISLIEKRKKLIFEKTKDIDRSVILSYEKQLKELQKKKFTLEKRKKETTEVDKAIVELTNAYEVDSKVKSITVYIEGCIEDAMLYLILDKETVPAVIPKLVEGDKSAMDFNDMEFIEKVVAKVIVDFFFITIKNSNT